jgi:hypothetical protein
MTKEKMDELIKEIAKHGAKPQAAPANGDP